MSKPDINLPFFAYGIFRQGEIAYFQIIDFVKKAESNKSIKGKLMFRDGLYIIDKNGGVTVEGDLIWFKENKAQLAYDHINGLEPNKHYSWANINLNNQNVNVLYGKSPGKGSSDCDEVNSWRDPLFTDAIEVVIEMLNDNKKFNNFKNLFKIQMAYLLLWSSIERYTSLRYHFGKNVTNKVNNLATENAFVIALKKHVLERRTVFSTSNPADDKEILSSENPQKSLDYYYQIRSNITHRGKGVHKDFDMVYKSLDELLKIFTDVLEEAQIEAKGKITK